MGLFGPFKALSVSDGGEIRETVGWWVREEKNGVIRGVW